jgi:hypothetical protein
MEPTWMALGQAAGVAASISIDDNVEPRNINVKKLQNTLLEQGQVIEHKDSDTPHPITNPESPIMLKGSWVSKNPHHIDFKALPKIKSQHSVVSDVRNSNSVNQHNYLIYHKGKFWIMWSDGPGVEDRVGQRVAFATSNDGLKWSKPKYITPYPPNSDPGSAHYNTRSDNGFRYISRGFWKRGKELLALVSIDEGNKFFGKSLELRAFRLDPDNESWEDIGLVYNNTINNFPPKILPNGEWMMTRRSYDRNVFMLTGGVEGFNQWQSHPVIGHDESELMPEEPYWWILPDNNLLALFRDNAGSGFLFRAFSTDNGRTWTKPVQTDFPDARSKFNGLQLSDGRFILVSNPNPKKRDPMALSISNDGIVFDKMGYLFGGRRIDYPHVIEHDGYLLIAFSGHKQSVEVLKIKIDDIHELQMPPVPLTTIPHSFIDKTKVVLKSNKMDVAIHYTLDGSVPTNKSPLYTIPFVISESTDVNIIEISSTVKKSAVGSIKYIKLIPLKPLLKSSNERGLKFEYFQLEEPIYSTSSILKLKPNTIGNIANFEFPYEDKKLATNFGLIFSGYIEVPKEGIYTFSIISNDGSKLFIGDQLVVNNEETRGDFEKEGDIALQAGKHKIQLKYFQSGGGKALKIFIRSSELEKVEIGDSLLSY